MTSSPGAKDSKLPMRELHTLQMKRAGGLTPSPGWAVSRPLAETQVAMFVSSTKAPVYAQCQEPDRAFISQQSVSEPFFHIHTDRPDETAAYAVQLISSTSQGPIVQAHRASLSATFEENLDFFMIGSQKRGMICQLFGKTICHAQ